MPAPFKSRVLEYEGYWEWYEQAVKQKLTDGLPLAVPTESSVRAILDYLGRDPQAVVGVIAPARGILTLEVLAVQCAMAGCLPEHVPVVEAAVLAMLTPEFSLHGVQSTTNAVAPLVVVNGSIIKDLGFNAGIGSFGGGSRANAAVGRAVRLILWNVGRGYPGEPDMAPHGQPAKYAFCVAENEEESPWEPLSVERGLAPGQDAVTVFACHSPQPLYTPGNSERMLRIMAATFPTPGVNMFACGGQYMVALGLTPARRFADEGWSRATVKQWLFDNARYKLGWLRENKVINEEGGEMLSTHWGHVEGHASNTINLPDDTMLPMVETVDDIHLIVTGSDHQWWIGFLPGWGSLGGYAVTQPVVRPR